MINPITLLKTFIFLSFCSFSFLISEEQVLPLSFSSFQGENCKNGQWVEIRGFLYEATEGHRILSAHPNLKSCCVGSVSKRNQQILVLGDLEHQMPSLSALTLRGNFFMESDKPFPFRLENAEIVKEDKKPYTLFLAAGGILLMSGLFFCFRLK